MTTLAEFQAGPGIPFKDQIILLNNPRFFDGFTPCFYPWRRIRNRARKFPRECLIRRLIYRPYGFSVPKGLGSDHIFAGFFDRSFDLLDNLCWLYDFMNREPHREFTLIIGKGDYSFSADRLAQLPSNVVGVYANNVCVTDPRIRYLPIGRDFRSMHLFDSMKPSAIKTTTCYCNFSTSTHPVRSAVHQMVRDKPFVEVDHMGVFLQYSLSREVFFKNLSASKFSICPRGNGLDTFRIWDSLYVGTIPIVVREAPFHDQWADLPILFLDRYEDFRDLNREQLEDVYAAMQGTLFDYSKLTAAHWLPSSSS